MDLKKFQFISELNGKKVNDIIKANSENQALIIFNKKHKINQNNDACFNIIYEIEIE